jgi:hypothetical protein
VILRLALRSLATRPLRTAVLAIGFGLGIGVMAELLGVGEVILEQAHAPALQGGGDLVVTGAIGQVDSARFLLSSVLGSSRFHARTSAVSPSKRATLFLLAHGQATAISVRGGVPSREKAIGDAEVTGQESWTDTPEDTAWTNPQPGDVLRAMDRFHPIPDIDERGKHPDAVAGSPVPPKPQSSESGSRASWAEWLYFNGKSADGSLRFYLTFMAGAPEASGKRPMFVRLQLNRAGKTTNYSTAATVDGRELLERAPDLDVGGNRVRLDGLQYRITLSLHDESTTAANPALTGEIVLDAARDRSLPPAAIHGAHGWVSGYVAPVLAGTFHGALQVRGEKVSVEGAAGYHDHNWGFWEGVRWQWGQVAGGDVSIIYGRIFPPATVADASRIPGVLGVLGPDGPTAFSTDVSIDEEDEGDGPKTISVHARGRQLELTLRLEVADSVATRLALTRSAEGMMNFLQLSGVYRVTGRVGDRDVNFAARGSAETFRTGASRP